MDEVDIRLEIVNHPEGELAHAYYLGRHDMIIEFQEFVGKIFKDPERIVFISDIGEDKGGK